MLSCVSLRPPAGTGHTPEPSPSPNAVPELRGAVQQRSPSPGPPGAWSHHGQDGGPQCGVREPRALQEGSGATFRGTGAPLGPRSPTQLLRRLPPLTQAPAGRSSSRWESSARAEPFRAGTAVRTGGPSSEHRPGLLHGLSSPGSTVVTKVAASRRELRPGGSTLRTSDTRAAPSPAVGVRPLGRSMCSSGPGGGGRSVVTRGLGSPSPVRWPWGLASRTSQGSKGGGHSIRVRTRSTDSGVRGRGVRKRGPGGKCSYQNRV